MIEKITKDLLIKCISEIKKDENQQLIELEILNPIFIQFQKKFYPYVSLLIYREIMNVCKIELVSPIYIFM
jgi:hypothetical protein